MDVCFQAKQVKPTLLSWDDLIPGRTYTVWNTTDTTQVVTASGHPRVVLYTLISMPAGKYFYAAINLQDGTVWDHDGGDRRALDTYGYQPCRSTVTVEI
jgi:hypothetical protein